MLNCIFVSAHTAGNSQLILGDKSAVLVDCSVAFCADETVENIKHALNGRALSAIVLSHSHYDHITALPQIHDAFPDARIYAHPYAAQIFKRESALALMKKMCDNAKELFGKGFCCREPQLSRLEITDILTDGEELPFDDGVMRVLFTPGHTKCSISLDFPQKGVAWLCETLGAPRPDGRVQPCFLVGYKSSLDACQRIKALGKRRVIISHNNKIMTEQQSEEFIAQSEKVIKDSAALICRLFNQGLDFSGIFDGYRQAYWDERYRAVWPYEAFKINSISAINTVLVELCNQKL